MSKGAGFSSHGQAHRAPPRRKMAVLHYGVLRFGRSTDPAVPAEGHGLSSRKGCSDFGRCDPRVGGLASDGLFAQRYQVAKRTG